MMVVVVREVGDQFQTGGVEELCVGVQVGSGWYGAGMNQGHFVLTKDFTKTTKGTSRTTTTGRGEREFCYLLLLLLML